MRTILFLPLLLPALYGQYRQVDPPALPGSGMPFFASGDQGNTYLSWTDPDGDGGHALRYSRWTGSQWTPPETIAAGKGWFVNWADFPSLVVQPGGSMLAHWLTRADGGSTFGYGIRVAMRTAASPVWRQIHSINVDDKHDYAGFLSFVPNGRAAIYLAPPRAARGGAHDGEHGHRKTARLVSFGPDGNLTGDTELDADVCSCCQTAIARTTSGLVAAYRDHLPGEIRDISVVRFVDGAWTPPVTLYPDGWRINGCPTDGPSVEAAGSKVAIAWLTRAGDIPKIQVALSADEGRTFQPPLRVDDGAPAGRPSIVALDDANYLLVWIEKIPGADGEIRLRRIAADGRLFPAQSVAPVPAGRATGFPKISVTGSDVLIAWRDQRVRAVLIPKQQLNRKELK